MADTTTTYLGLKLRNPIIVGSSGLTDSAAKIQDLEKKGAGAVVVKSIFEEEILLEYKKLAEEGALAGQSFEALDYLDLEVRAERLDAYMKLISDARKRVSIPVIASINCTYSHEWVSFARALQSAGADALELNVFFLPSDPRRTSARDRKVLFRHRRAGEEPGLSPRRSQDRLSLYGSGLHDPAPVAVRRRGPGAL